MQIIIPMSGYGERFRRAGYSVPKPLIEVEGKPIVGHIVDMFPGETDFIFVCSKDHIADPAFRMEAMLRQLCPTGRIVGIEPHKLGPVHALLQVAGLIDLDRPVVVNYCDFTCYWNWQEFKTYVRKCACDGAIPAYRGFHPHTLGTTNYAYMREAEGWVLDIQEKQPYTDNRMEEYASSGTYYFASGALMLDAFTKVVAQNLCIGGEFYVSLAYKPLLNEGRSIAVYDLQHFMQWGTPEDLAEYVRWSNLFRQLVDGRDEEQSPVGSVIVPMAGLGQRFSREGYLLTKPLIPVSGAPMVVQAARDLPRANRYVFVVRRDMPGYDEISNVLSASFPNILIETIEVVTEGQACTTLIGLNALAREFSGENIGPVTVGTCDNGALYSKDGLAELLDDGEIDVLVWGVRSYPNAARQPQMYGWIDANEGEIKSISVKQPLSDPAFDPIVLGAFTFRRAEDLHRCITRMVERNAKVNGEFYLDTCINDAIALGLRCRLFEVDAYLSWGTPNDLRTFEYWQSCFHKWPTHPYDLSKDRRVAPDACAELERRFQATPPLRAGIRE